MFAIQAVPGCQQASISLQKNIKNKSSRLIYRTARPQVADKSN